MQCNLGERMGCGSLYWCTMVTVLKRVQSEYHHLCPVTAEGNKVKALFDSGSMITLVSAHLVEATKLGKSQDISITCIHGDTC